MGLHTRWAKIANVCFGSKTDAVSLGGLLALPSIVAMHEWSGAHFDPTIATAGLVGLCRDGANCLFGGIRKSVPGSRTKGDCGRTV